MTPTTPDQQLTSGQLAGHCVSLWDEANAVTDKECNDYHYKWMCYFLASAQHSAMRAEEHAKALGVDPSFIRKP